jgi:hypothetical protein
MTASDPLLLMILVLALWLTSTNRDLLKLNERVAELEKKKQQP